MSHLVELVWGEAPPSTAPNILQGHVSRLRKALGADVIARIGAAYGLERDVEVDATRFSRLVADGDMSGALDLWAGDPLTDLEPVGLQPAVDGLRKRWLDAGERHRLRLAEADPAAAVGLLTELTQTDPFRERAWAALMLALARTDRQADALAAFRRARAGLVDELGIDPGERLRAVEARILAGEVDPVGPPERPLTPVPAADGRLAALPAVPGLIGRERDVEVVLGALLTASLGTLLGTGDRKDEPGSHGRPCVAGAAGWAGRAGRARREVEPRRGRRGGRRNARDRRACGRRSARGDRVGGGCPAHARRA